MFVGRNKDFFHRTIPNSSFGVVDDALEGLFVGWVDGKAEVGHEVLDLFALVERESTYDFIGQIQFAKCLLHGAGLGVGPVEYGKVTVLEFLVVFLLKDGGCHEPSLLVVGGGFDQFDQVSLGVGGPYHLFELGLVLVNDGVGRFHDGLGGAVVLLQLHYKQVRIVFLEIQDVLNIRTAKGINTLGIVTHHADVLVYCCQFFGDQVLGNVGILKLVHHDVFEALLVLVEYFEVIAEEYVGIEE